MEEVLLQIAGSITKVETIIAEISNANNEKLAAITEVKQAVIELDGNTIKNATLIEQTSAVALSLIQKTSKMIGIMSFFIIIDYT